MGYWGIHSFPSGHLLNAYYAQLPRDPEVKMTRPASSVMGSFGPGPLLAVTNPVGGHVMTSPA
jgi:hypothetical protein